MRWVCLLFAAVAWGQTEPAATPAELQRAAVDKQRAAIAIQQGAIRTQAKNVGVVLMPWSLTAQPGGEPPACDPMTQETVTPIIESAAKANNLEAKLVRALIE